MGNQWRCSFGQTRPHRGHNMVICEIEVQTQTTRNRKEAICNKRSGARTQKKKRNGLWHGSHDREDTSRPRCVRVQARTGRPDVPRVVCVDATKLVRGRRARPELSPWSNTRPIPSQGGVQALSPAIGLEGLCRILGPINYSTPPPTPEKRNKKRMRFRK